MKLSRPTTDREPLWKDEFSINAAEERYVTRRQFTKFLVLTSLGMFVGNLWILAKSLLRKAPSYAPAVIGKAAEVPGGGVKIFSYPRPEDPCILVAHAGSAEAKPDRHRRHPGSNRHAAGYPDVAAHRRLGIVPGRSP